MTSDKVPIMHSKILILDFGSQVTQLIARRVRDSGVFSEVFPYDVSEEFVRNALAVQIVSQLPGIGQGFAVAVQLCNGFAVVGMGGDIFDCLHDVLSIQSEGFIRRARISTASRWWLFRLRGIAP